jgi:hypothetical protein
MAVQIGIINLFIGTSSVTSSWKEWWRRLRRAPLKRKWLRTLNKLDQEGEAYMKHAEKKILFCGGIMESYGTMATYATPHGDVKFLRQHPQPPFDLARVKIQETKHNT